MEDQPVVVPLPRGGMIVQTPIGSIQVGMPPDTIKDTMKMGMAVPKIFVYPKELFDRRIGVNVAEAEFPAYWNFFINKNKVTFVCTAEQEKRIRKVFQETLLGPVEIDISREISPLFPRDQIPNLRKEFNTLKSFESLDSLVNFVLFDENGFVTLTKDDEAVHIQTEENYYIISDKNRKQIARVPSSVKIPAHLRKFRVTHSDFQPPLFGITILGSSHGFDPEKNTTGFVLWINRRGIIVDPPLGSAGYLHSRGVPLRLIDHVIVTHCHADHDSGTFQILLNEQRITLLTTRTIMGSFTRKYAAIANVEEDFLSKLFLFRPVVIGDPIHIHGGQLSFFYTYHTIPTVGFWSTYGGKSIYYSSDTFYDPATFQKLYEEGVMLEGRKDWFCKQPWNYNVILHECGVPPIHTPVATLAALPEEVKERLYLVHASEKTIPKDQGLKIAREGIENSIRVDVVPHPNALAIEMLLLASSADIFGNMGFREAAELLQAAELQQYPANAVIIEHGSIGDAVYIISWGVVTVLSHDKSNSKYLIAGDYFGEMSLALRTLRTATVFAKTNVQLIKILKGDFALLLQKYPDVIEFLKQLHSMRAQSSWDVICANSALSYSTNSQKREFQGIIRPREVVVGQHLVKRGELAEEAYLVATAELIIEEMEEEDDLLLDAGAIVGDFNALMKDGETKSRCTIRVKHSGTIYATSKKNFLWYIERNPGFLLRLKDCWFVEGLDDLELLDAIEMQQTSRNDPSITSLRRASRLGVYKSMEILL